MCIHACTHNDANTREDMDAYDIWLKKHTILVWKLLSARLIKSVSAGYKLQRVETGGERNCPIHKGGFYLIGC